jgi:hypothetical protein
MERLRVKLRFIASAVLVGVIGLVVIAGCGGGGSSSSSGGSSSFASGAEGACSKANKEIAALGTPQQEQVLEYLESTEDIIAELHGSVEALRPSGSAEKAYTQALGESVIVLNHMANAARNENFDAVREISDELIEFKVGELAEAANLKSCAEVPEATS